MQTDLLIPPERAVIRAKARLRHANEGGFTKGRARYTVHCAWRGVAADYHSLTQAQRFEWELAADKDPQARRPSK